MSDSIKSLSPKHQMILYRRFFGETHKAIASSMNLTEKHVCRIVNSPVFKEEMQKLSNEFRARVIDSSAEVREVLNLAAPQAAKKVVQIMESAPEVRDQRRAAKDVVELSDYGQNREGNKQPLVLTQQQLIQIDAGLRGPDE